MACIAVDATMTEDRPTYFTVHCAQCGQVSDEPHTLNKATETEQEHEANNPDHTIFLKETCGADEIKYSGPDIPSV